MSITGVYLRTIEGQVLTFAADDYDTYTEEETGCTWDILGKAIDGPSLKNILMGVPYHDTFWFVRMVFVPDSDLLD